LGRGALKDMHGFTEHKGLCVPLYLANIDTDQIVPKKFLLRVERTGYDEALFYEWRFDADGIPKKDFVLNDPRYVGASILIAGPNFGCGSSREHAPWAIYEYGFRVIISESYADIFYNNCFKTGILPLKMEGALVRELAERAASKEGLELSVSLENLTVSDGDSFRQQFALDAFRRECLVKGLDDIELTLARSPEIAEFESSRVSFLGP
jgi:3-isopropylmalate/(R)-2-methylmalate dehydratase small subunit